MPICCVQQLSTFFPYAGPDNIPADDDAVAKYGIGADFCIERDNTFFTADGDYDYDNDIAEYVIACDLVDSLPSPFPAADRRWYKDGILIYTLPAEGTENPTPLVMDNVEFNAAFPMLMPSSDDFNDVLLFNDEGSITFSFFTFLFGNREYNISELIEQLSGNWTCSVNNSLGADTATTLVGICGKLEHHSIKSITN